MNCCARAGTPRARTAAWCTSDASIYRVDVVDSSGRGTVSVVSETASAPQRQAYAAPIRKQVIWINLFSDNGTPHVTAARPDPAWRPRSHHHTEPA